MMNYKKMTLLTTVAAVLIATAMLLHFRPENSSPHLESSSADVPDQPEPPSNISEFDRQALYSLINAHRKEAGLSGVRIEPSLEMSAQAKIKDMLDHNYYRHQDTQNQESWYLFTNAGYNFKKAGENIAFQHNTPWQVFDGWVNSETHNQQLLEPLFEDMGLAVDCENITEVPGKNCIVVLHLGLK